MEVRVSARQVGGFDPLTRGLRHAQVTYLVEASVGDTKVFSMQVTRSDVQIWEYMKVVERGVITTSPPGSYRVVHLMLPPLQ